MTKTKLFIFGDSHTIVIASAFKSREAAGSTPRGRVTIVRRLAQSKTLEDGRVIATADFTSAQALEMLSKAGRQTAFVSVIGGNTFNGVGMMQHPVAFDYFEPDLPDAPVDETAAIIPVSVLEQQFDQALRLKDWKSILSLRTGFNGRAFHLAPPPPKEDNEFIARNAESQFRQLGIEKVGVSPPLLRLKLWHLQKRVMDRLCASADMRQLAPPAAALTPEGFLSRAYYGKDATHANPAYGGLVLDMIEQEVLSEESVA